MLTLSWNPSFTKFLSVICLMILRTCMLLNFIPAKKTTNNLKMKRQKVHFLSQQSEKNFSFLKCPRLQKEKKILKKRYTHQMSRNDKKQKLCEETLM